MLSNGALLFATGYFAPEALTMISEALDIVVKRVRPQLIPLCESWFLEDEMWPSSIGNKYGDIYETQLDWAKNSRLNKLDEQNGGKPSYFDDLIKPFLKSDYAKL